MFSLIRPICQKQTKAEQTTTEYPKTKPLHNLLFHRNISVQMHI